MDGSLAEKVRNTASRASLSTELLRAENQPELSVLCHRRKTPQTAKPLGLIDLVHCTDGPIHLPFMISFLVNVSIVGTEDFLTACKVTASHRTVICGPPVRVASQDQHFTFLGVVTALFANVECLLADLCLLVRVLVSLSICSFRSDGEGFRQNSG